MGFSFNGGFAPPHLSPGSIFTGNGRVLSCLCYEIRVYSGEYRPMDSQEFLVIDTPRPTTLDFVPLAKDRSSARQHPESLFPIPTSMREGDGEWMHGERFALVGQLWSITAMNFEVCLDLDPPCALVGSNRVRRLEWILGVRSDLTSLPPRRIQPG